jgi:membrane dipeptidase
MLPPFLFLLAAGAQAASLPDKYRETTRKRVERVLAEFPVIDGHNDFPMGLRQLLRNDISKLDFDTDLTKVEPWASYWANHIDLPRMRRGKMGGQFWSAFIGCSAQFHDAVQLFLEQIDVIRQFVSRYPDDLHWATSVADIEEARAEGKIASLIGVESGHAIGSSLPLVRTLYRMGARYMTLTHGCNTPWADAAQVEVGDFPPRVGGLSEFGEKVVREMNRLGMLVDLSHVSSDAMRQALAVTRAPVIFSHSGARAICSYPRNVPDDVLQMVAEKGGIVMVNFFPYFLTDDYPARNATVQDVVAHINHIRAVAGVEHVGIGGDYNGINVTPVGLEDVSHYPEVFAALIEDGTYDWTDEELGLLASQNLINTFRAVEEVRDLLASEGEEPDNSWIPVVDLGSDTGCNSDFPPKP